MTQALHKAKKLAGVEPWKPFGMVLEYSTLSHHHPTENNVTSAGARSNEDSLALIHKFALLRALTHHTSAGHRELLYPSNQETRNILVQKV